jgi:hypothetical protein
VSTGGAGHRRMRPSPVGDAGRGRQGCRRERFYVLIKPFLLRCSVIFGVLSVILL